MLPLGWCRQSVVRAGEGSYCSPSLLLMGAKMTRFSEPAWKDRHRRTVAITPSHSQTRSLQLVTKFSEPQFPTRQRTATSPAWHTNVNYTG
jgi:hypothetical protein